MANPGAGAKFLSVNLNKSYGQSGHSSSSSSSYGTGRGRPGGYSAGSGGMVVLSRPRSSHNKAAPKLSVPPPVNLPSLRKEHERFDPLGSGSGSVSGIGPGNGPRPVSSAMGWSKAAAATQLGRDGIDNARPSSGEGWEHPKQFADNLNKSSGPLPAANFSRIGSNLSIPVQPEKTSVLRGEDFPSLSATISATSGPSHKQKNGLHNQKHEIVEDSSSSHRDSSHLSAEIDMRPRGHSLQSSATDGVSANRGDGLFSGAGHLSEQSRKQDSRLPVPLPLVRLYPRSDWADDERDTSHAFSDRGRDLGFSKMEPYWDKDFDFPRSSIVPHKPAQNNIDRWTRHDDNKSYGLGGKQPFHNSAESSNGREAEWNMRERSRNVPELNRHKAESVLSSVSNPSSTSAGKGISGSDSSLNFGRGKQTFSRVEKSSVEEWGSTGFDESDPFSGNLLGIVKRKKETSKQVDFHDPVRESFEAELERVQKLQEQERQRIIKEQERALEMARKEEEERLRVLREQEEHQRHMEEEAREAAWRVEQERVEAIRKAEEHKTVREEEKRRLSMEEERRKQAAKQKLLELEQRIARRQAEATKVDGSSALLDERVSRAPIERDTSRVDDHSSWEDSERAVDRIRSSAPSYSSVPSRSFDTGSSVHPLRDGSSAFTDRVKSDSWRRDVFENGSSSPLFPPEQVNGHRSPRRDTFAGGRGFPRYSANGYVASRNYYGGGFLESQLDDFSHGRNKDLDSEFHGAGADRFNEMDLNQGNSQGSLHAPYGDRAYQNSELDELYSYGRPRYSSRQPRVLPPPMASMHRTSLRSDGQHTSTSTYGEGNQYNHASRSELAVSMYDHDQQEMQDADSLDVQEESGKMEVQNLNRSNVLGCDSQSSLSVSSPPHSPAHLSHDDLDDTGDSLGVYAPAENIKFPPSGNDHIVLDTETGREKLMTASSCVSAGDDDEWAVESNADLQEHRDYDEDEDGYREEDEENERDKENDDLALEFEGMHLDGKDCSTMENLVLGFDQGVEVGIPSDEFERNPGYKENSHQIHQVSANESSGDKREDASGVVQEAQNMVNQPIDDSCTPAFSDMSNSSSHSHATTISGSQPVLSSANMNSFSSGPAIISSASSASSQNQAEMPVKLQFGLFSGPSLIPSPIPAIQIGSIQMPLQLPNQVGSSISHIHPQQPTLFQFGQIRYPSPVSHGILHLAPQSTTCGQLNVQGDHPLNQKPRVPSTAEPYQDGFAHSFMKDYTFPLIVERQHHDSPKSGVPQNVFSKEVGLVKESQNAENDAHLLHQNTAHESSSAVNRTRVESSSQSARRGFHSNAGTNIASRFTRQASEAQIQHGSSSTQSFSSGVSLSRAAVHGQASGNRGRKVPVTARSHTQRSPFSGGDTSHSHATGFQKRPRRGAQRMEFRVRQNSDRRQSYGSLTHQAITDMTPNNYGKSSGAFTRYGLQKETPYDSKGQAIDSGNLGSDQSLTQGNNLQMKANKGNQKEALMNRPESSHQAEGRLKRHMSSEEDVDAPLQSGIVRIFNQPGIEAPSDEDNFIEVRSKRQMLNDRREQREKEKAKSKIKKAMKKPRATQGASLARTIVKLSTSSNREAPKGIDADDTQSWGLINQEMATASNVVSPSLAPIGPPLLNLEAQAGSNSHSHTEKIAQASSVRAISASGQPAGLGLAFESEKKRDNIQTSLGSWDDAHINQEVMPLTQTQFDDAMKPEHVDLHSSSAENHINSVSEIGRSTSTVVMNDTQFASAASPLKSLLAGEKIQFGAVTSPAVLPSNDRDVAHGIVPPGSEKIQFGAITSPTIPPCNRSVPHSIGPPASEKIQFGALPSPIVLPSRSSPSVPHEKHLEDCEAEAEAAASAIAVAAISNDEGRNGLGSSTDMDGLTSSGAAHNQPTCESKTEEALAVSLPADLSVETPPISLWPPLPSPHASSSHILSPYPGGTPSPFPFYDMNPMLGGPVYAFNPHDESAGGSVSQPQKTSTSDSGPHGNWQPCHSGVDSFYGPPAGFPGPFINPPGSIPGVQAPPHMVVYNHFAPVGRFGQVGLSYMGTYISSTKQPDWKHNPAPNSGAEAEIKNLNMVSVQHNTPGVVPQPQHHAPGSALLPMASPSVAMFDVSAFQSSAELPAQPRWSHVPALPSIQPPPHTMPLQQRADDVMPPQLRVMPTENHSQRSNRFSNPQTPPEKVAEAVVTDATKPHPAPKFGLEDPQNSSAPKDNTISNPNAVSGPSNTTNMQNMSSGQRQHNHRPGYNYQRGGGAPQKSSSGAEWSGRRTGFHGRNQPGNGGRGFPPTKMKQIYVAKQSSASGASTIQ